MKTVNPWKLTLALLCSSVVSSCGGVGGDPMTATTGPFVMSMFGASLNTLPTSNTMPTLPVNGATTNMIETKAVGCETITPNPTVDADNDGIAAYKKYTYDCTDSQAAGYTYTQKGTIEIKDMDETKTGVYGGVRVDFNLPVYISTDLSTGKVYESSYTGYWDYVNSGGSLISKSSYTGSSKYEANGFVNDYSHTATWNYKMTPTSTATPWVAGSIEMDGTFLLNGKFILDGQNGHSQQEGSWLISYKTENLTYDAGCAKFYRSGSFVITDSANKIEIVYSCTTAKLYVNGAESNWWTP